MPEKSEKFSTIATMQKYIQEIEAFADEFMESIFDEGPSWNTETNCLNALSNVLITPREVIVTADFPNVEPETVKIQKLNENIFEITAKMKQNIHFTDLGIYHRQGQFSFLRCQEQVNVAIDSERMKVSCLEGFLEIRFPRKNKDHQ